jgi:hypothetical protein
MTDRNVPIYRAIEQHFTADAAYDDAIARRVANWRRMEAGTM